jgi:hypothetical protein
MEGWPVSPRDSHRERRIARRIRMAGCKARLKSLLTGEVFYGECFDLSVDGLSIRTAFVPQFGEVLEVMLRTPAVGSAMEKPLIVEAEVRRCNELEPGRLYEIGMAILERKS